MGGCVEQLKTQPTFGQIRRIYTTDDVDVTAGREILLAGSGMSRCEFQSNRRLRPPGLSPRSSRPQLGSFKKKSELSGRYFKRPGLTPRPSSPRGGSSNQELAPSGRHFERLGLLPHSSFSPDGPSGRFVGPTGSFPRSSGP